MTKMIQVAIAVVAASVVCQSVVYAEELGQPVRFSVGVLGKMTDNRDAVDVNEQDNVDLYVNPRVDVVYDGKNTRLNLFYVPSYRYRTEPGDTQDESTWQHSLGVSGLHAVSQRTRLRFEDRFSKTDDPAIEEGGITMRGDQSYKRNALNAAINYDLLRYSNIDLELRSRTKSYDDSVVALQSDEDEIGVTVGHRYQISRTLRSLASVDYAEYTYSSSDTLERDFSTFIASVGVENNFTPDLFGTLAVGWQTRDYADSSLNVNGTPYARASLEGNLNSGLTLGSVVSHGSRDADAYPFVSQEYTDLRGFVDSDLSPSINLRVSGTYRLSTYDQSDVPAGTVATSGDETTTVGDVQLTFAIANNMSISVGQRYEDINSDVGQSYTKNTSRVGATLSF